MNLRFDRRRFLQAMGLGGLALSSGSVLSLPNRARAGGFVPPKRVVFFISPHGTVWNHWKLPIPGVPDATPLTAATTAGTRSLADLAESEWPTILAPLRPFASKLQVVEGISALTTLANERDAYAADAASCVNRHHIAQANLLTVNTAMQRSGSTAIGGAMSVDQYAGLQTQGTRTWATRVYGANHQHPYSFVAAGEEAPRVESGAQAFADIMGTYVPPSTGAPSRADLIRTARGSVLDLVANEYDRIAPRLSGEDRLKLERHRDLIRDLERSFGASGTAAVCSPSFTASTCDATIDACADDNVNRCVGNTTMDDFAQVITLALACDLTRVVTYVTPNLSSWEFGHSCEVDVHQDYAHNSIDNVSTYTADAEQGMVDYNTTYARHFARLLAELDSVPEGDGTLLDNTAVVWISELGTGTHELVDVPVVIAGGTGFFAQGRYTRLAAETQFAGAWGSRFYVGATMSQVYVTLLRYLGLTDESFGLSSVDLSIGGSSYSLAGELAGLRV